MRSSLIFVLFYFKYIYIYMKWKKLFKKSTSRRRSIRDCSLKIFCRWIENWWMEEERSPSEGFNKKRKINEIQKRIEDYGWFRGCNEEHFRILMHRRGYWDWWIELYKVYQPVNPAEFVIWSLAVRWLLRSKNELAVLIYSDSKFLFMQIIFEIIWLNRFVMLGRRNWKRNEKILHTSASKIKI